MYWNGPLFPICVVPLKLLDLPKARRYEPQNACIYCGTTGQPLTLEHIIPYALEGDLELPAAVCQLCQKTTWWAENECLREMFLGARTHLRIRTRRKRQRPTTLPVGVFDGPPELPMDMRSSNFRWLELPVDQHPHAIMLPTLPHPGMLVDRVDGRGLTLTGTMMHLLRAPTHPGSGENHVVIQKLVPDAFARMLAKIGHGLAIAELGMNSLVPILPDFILRRRSDFSSVIGSSKFGRFGRTNLVEASLHLEQGFVVARIQLFAKFGFQAYEVVTGNYKGPIRNWSSSARALRQL